MYPVPAYSVKSCHRATMAHFDMYSLCRWGDQQPHVYMDVPESVLCKRLRHAQCHNVLLPCQAERR